MDLDRSNDAVMAELFEVLNASNGDQMRSLLQSLLNVLMRLEREEALGAKPYERSEERKGYANGFKPKLFKSRLGQLDLQVPQVRGFSFYPQALEKGSRSERALKLAVAEMYLKGSLHQAGGGRNPGALWTRVKLNAGLSSSSGA